MAILSVSDFTLFINRQLKSQERIESCLWRLEALMTMALMTNDFYNFSNKILHNYFSIMSDLIEEIEKANQESLNDLLRKVR